MRSISGRLENKKILLDVGLRAGNASLDSVGPLFEAQTLKVHQYKALMDTGATKTCITRSAVKEMGLRPRGKVPMGNVNGIEHHTSYSFVVGFWLPSSDDFSPPTYYGLEPTLGVDCADNHVFGVIIGMDIISRGDLTIRRNGTYEFILP